MDTTATTGPPLLQVRGLAKEYGAIRALRGVDVAFHRGEIHGLVGANGAGKSTLVRSLAGLEQPDQGEILVDGEPVHIRNPAAAAALGFAFIHQELNLVSTFTGAQNIVLGNDRGKPLRLKGFAGVPDRVRVVAERIGIDFSLEKPVGQLTVHQQWLISIARALVNDCRLIAMDEPTASLGEEEAARLMGVAKGLAAEGVAILFISHRLDEVTSVCDRVTAFRDGQVVLTLSREQVTRSAIVDAIVGHSVVPGERKDRSSDPKVAPVVLSLENVRRGTAVRNATLRLHKGELLGIAGLVGAGRTELARIIYGADQPDGGSMTYRGRPYTPKSVQDAIARSITYVPEERRAEALFLNLPIESNLHISNWKTNNVAGTPFTSMRKSKTSAAQMCQRLGVVLREGGTGQPISALSGGNQQKVVIGRWMALNPEILILDEPTRGVDVGARADIYARIREIAASGTSVIVISSEFEELLECDRVVVLAGGKTVAELEGDSVTVPDMLHRCYS